MATAESFTQKILTEPDDDDQRLVFADWLDDHGDAAYGHFIRVQCALAGMKEDDPGYAELKAREQELWEENGERWTAEILPEKLGASLNIAVTIEAARNDTHTLLMHRGLPGRLKFVRRKGHDTFNALPYDEEQWRALLEWASHHPISTMESALCINDMQYEYLARSVLLRRLHRLKSRNIGSDSPEGGRKLRLREFEMSHGIYQGLGVFTAQSACQNIISRSTQLTRLALMNMELYDCELARIAREESLRRLRSLQLRKIIGDISAKTVSTILRDECLPSLKEMDLRGSIRRLNAREHSRLHKTASKRGITLRLDPLEGD